MTPEQHATGPHTSPLFDASTTVLLHVAQHPYARIREIEGATGLNERMVRRRLDDLYDAGLLRRVPTRNYNRYEVVAQAPLYEGASVTVAAFLELLGVEG